jgi:hypothetical protein
VGERASRAGAACSGWGWRLCRSFAFAVQYVQVTVYKLLWDGMRSPWGSGSFSGARWAGLGCGVEDAPDARC